MGVYKSFFITRSEDECCMGEINISLPFALNAKVPSTKTILRVAMSNAAFKLRKFQALGT